ncbi:MAG: hypothetical protein PHU34_09520 [Candidatus Methanoperedens sp.]|nr:hypothetical protein [Candidatus Methanoperedens sp.]
MVDIDTQKLFKAAEPLHGKTIADALEIGILTLLKDIDPVAVIELEISRKAEDLEGLRKLRAEMKVSDSQQKRLKQYTQSAEQTEKARLVFWNKEKELLKRDLRRGNVNWTRILWDYKFESRKEAINWFRYRIETETKNTTNSLSPDPVGTEPAPNQEKK